MNLEDRSVVLWIAVLFVTLAGLFVGADLGIRAGGSGFFGGLFGLILGFAGGVFGARWTLGR